MTIEFEESQDRKRIKDSVKMNDSCPECKAQFTGPSHTCKPHPKPEAKERFAESEISALVSAWDGDITDLDAAKLIIDRQAEQIKRLEVTEESCDHECSVAYQLQKQLEAKAEDIKQYQSEIAMTHKDNLELIEKIRVKDQEIASWRCLAERKHAALKG